ncbi:hypothetical protein B6I21_04060 [candidate division KSB1 bacterium 4572_119]|nr:MAG: hypothetical protein B6I21_04060 [candidate division KSB1 bacterium 4572_119]
MNKKNFFLIWIITIFVFGQAYAGQLSSVDYQKIDPSLAVIIDHPDMQPLIFQQTIKKPFAQNKRINVILKTTLSRSELNNLKISVFAKIGEIVTASVPLSEIVNIIKTPEIKYIQLPKAARTRNDMSVPEIGVPQTRSQFGLTGRGIIIGIVDTGIDWRHEDFRNADGTTRIKALLDFSDPGDTNGDEILDGTGPYGGTLYTEADINNAINGTFTVSESDVVGHGTHVAGSAAGNGFATDNGVPAETYVGVAPEADLVIVKGTRTLGSRNFLDFDYINAANFIDSLAISMNKPYVANLSLGGSNGPHDGKDLSEQALDILVGSGIKGKSIVISAGNDGEQAIHSSGTFSGGTNRFEIDFNIPSYIPNSSNMDDYVIFEAWYEAANSYQVSVISPNNNVIGPVSSGNESGRDTNEGAVFISNARGGPSTLNGDKQIQIQVYDYSSSNFPRQGTWKIVFEGTSGRFDLWLAGSSMGAQITSNIDNSMIAGTPGTSFNAITVGSYITKTNWTDLDGNSLYIPGLVSGAASGFSSPGPTRDNRIKPEICAPGELIAASYSSDAAPGSYYSMFYSGSPSYPNAYVARDNKHAISQGTSFSAPHVAGTVALMLQQNPNLDAIQIRDAIIQSARTDNFTTSQNKWGYGKLDAYEAVQYIIDNPPVTSLNLSVFQNPALTQYIDFYLIAKSSLQGTPAATIQIGTGSPVSLAMTQLESLLYKGEYVLTESGTATLTVNATIQGENEETLLKYFNVTLLKVNVGGSINYENLSLNIAQNSIHKNSYFTVFSETISDSEPELKQISKSFKIGPAGYNFDEPVQIQMTYSDHLPTEYDESQISIYKLLDENWHKIPCQVNLTSNTVTANISQLGVFALFYDKNDTDPVAPVTYSLSQNYPNPFNANTNISFYLPKETEASLKVFNIKGELIKTLKTGKLHQGYHDVLWDGKNDLLQSVSSGVYFFRLSNYEFSATQKMILIK